MVGNSDNHHPLVIYDDREQVDDDVRSMIGSRGFGSIRVRGETISERVHAALPDWARDNLVHLTGSIPLEDPYRAFPALEWASGVIVLAARGALLDEEGLTQVCERARLSATPLADRNRQPMLLYFASVETFLDEWPEFARRPLHLDRAERRAEQCFKPPHPLLDISARRDFLDYTSGATKPRAFNAMEINQLTFVKKSADKAKMKAEHDFFHLVPDSFKAWLVAAYNFQDKGDYAQYEMPRCYIADAAIQWVHKAWTREDHESFLERIFFFLDNRPRRPASADEMDRMARLLFVDKVKARYEQMTVSPTGRDVVSFLRSSRGGDHILRAYEDYFVAIEEVWREVVGTKELVIGHGDPCLSNILYDSPTYQLQLIDPKGATSEPELWTHPMYDFAKLSHSILGDYDFINSGRFSVKLDAQAHLQLEIEDPVGASFKEAFLARITGRMSVRVLRLCEASLFLSMVPLHMDRPDKVVGFILRARAILDGLAKE